jgi:hypothetical protein
LCFLVVVVGYFGISPPRWPMWSITRALRAYLAVHSRSTLQVKTKTPTTTTTVVSSFLGFEIQSRRFQETREREKRGYEIRDSIKITSSVRPAGLIPPP